MAPRTFLFVLILILSFIFFKYGTIETHARTFLTLNILSMALCKVYRTIIDNVAKTLSFFCVNFSPGRKAERI